MGVAAGPKVVTEGLVFSLDARNSKTFDDIPGITDHGISDWYCFVSGTATYSAIYPNTEIIEIDADGNEVGIVTTGSDPQRGTFTTTSGRRYYGTKAIHILEEGVNDAIAPVSFAGTYFGNYHVRNDPKTVNIYAPQDDINVSVYENVTGGVTGTATSTFSISRGSSDTYVTTAGQDVYMILATDKPAIMTVGSDADDNIMMPMSQYTYRRRYDSTRPGRTINNTEPSNLNDNRYVLYDTSLPVFSLEIADGAGGDCTQGIGYEYLSDTYSWGNSLSDYQLVAPYADTTITVSYWENNQWNVGEVHSLNGTQTSPDAAFRDGSTGFGGNGGNIAGSAENLASGANLWKFEGTQPFALIINDTADDEERLLGWMSNKYLRTSSNVTQSFVNLIDKDDRSRMKIYGKDLTTTVEYAGAKLSAGDYIEFDGIDDAIYISDNFNDPQRFSIEAWVYPTELDIDENNNYRKLILAYDASPTNLFVVIEQEGTVRVRVPGSSDTSGLNYDAFSGVNEWGHIVCTYDQSTVSGYFNGELINTKSDSSATVDFGSRLLISVPGESSGPNTFKGRLAGVRIYNQALTASEVKQNFNATRGRFGI